MGHTTPEEAAQAFIDLNVRVLLGIHWEEPLDEPPRRVLVEIQRRGITPSAPGYQAGEDTPLVKMTGMTTGSHLSNRERNPVSTTPSE